MAVKAYRKCLDLEAWLTPRMQEAPPRVIFFDGVCNLCNAAVDFIIRRDKQRRFKFAPLQSPVAKDLLPGKAAVSLKGLNTIIYYRKGKVYYRSRAVILILEDLGGVYRVVRIFKLFPPRFTDLLYKLIANNRYRVFGKKETCRMPSPEERAQFL